ncbi:MAG: hypothetical protein H6Q14_2544 [Bacteroidetes bacterium]|nr:hypothetical protein [Bacteroidota bacterium]
MRNNLKIWTLFLDFCYMANILYAMLTILLPVYYFVGHNDSIETFLETNFIYTNVTCIFIRGCLTLFTVIFWIYCFVTWVKYDRRMTRLLLLLFFSCFYAIFYFRKIKKEKWI